MASVVNQFLTNEYTETIQKVIQEVVNDPSTYRGSAYMPSVAMPVRKIRTEVIEATGGLTQAHVPGTSPKYIQSFGTRVQEYEAPFWKEAIHYDESKILFLRELGNNGRNVRGVQQYISKDIDRLNRRIEARIELLRWRSIFDGGFSYLGKTLSFGLPSANRATPIGPLWSLDNVNANNAANPIIDLRYWLTGGLGPFRKYTVSKIVMNPNTARWLLDNNNTRQFLTSYGANPGLQGYDVNKVLNFLIPGLPEVDVYNAWYQEETVVNGKVTVGNAIYFIQDGEIFFEVSNLPGGDKIGEFVQGLNLAGGSVENPSSGKFLVIEDNTAPGTKGGVTNPYLDLVGGVYGGPKLDRGFDVLTAKVIA
jgi:hypothetical protein